MKQFFVEITDTFGGEANYSWVTRHKVAASTMRGAMWRISRDSGISWNRVDYYGDSQRWDSKSGATCAFVYEWDESLHSNYSNVNTL